MLHNTHVYFSSQLYKSDDSLLVIGSLLPDIAVTGIIKWEGGLHGFKETDNFMGFINENYPDFINLYKGILAHNILDDFTHNSYLGENGYAYQGNEELIELVKNYYDLDVKKARGLAHNYIETGVDILLLKRETNIPKEIIKAVKSLDKQKLSTALSSYFGISNSNFYNALIEFFEVFTKYDLTELNNWSNLWGELETLLSFRVIDRKKKEKLLLEAIEIVKDTYKDFLIYSLKEGSAMVKERGI